MSKFFIIFLALGCFNNVLLIKKQRQMVFRHVTCIAQSDIVKHSGCDVRVLPDECAGLNVMFELNSELAVSADVQVLLNYRLINGTKVVRFLNMKTKVCDMLVHVPTVSFVKIILNGLARHSNLPLSCPVRKNIMYNITDLPLSASMWPPYMPLVHFNFTLNFTDKQKPLFFFHLQAAVVSK
uniref:MD-2-related lipid-recognition domain-containing protein n=1 Tax=Stomoxys calcitrans TaxID=35570 RepID=A0A1I8PXG5_STOCA